MNAWRDRYCGNRAPFSRNKEMKLKIAPQLGVREGKDSDKFSQMFCWNIDTSFTPFMSFSMTTPAKPARLEESTVKKAGRKGMESCCVPDLAI